MKKIPINTDILAICFMVVLVIGLFASAVLSAVFSDPEPQTQAESETFTVVEKSIYWEIVYHNETKVMYVASRATDSRGVFTLLVNPDGSPMVYSEE